MSDDNIIPFNSIQGDKKSGSEDEFPISPYLIIDLDDNEYEHYGYLIFTSHHVCIMEKQDGKDPVAGFMIPLHRVKIVTIFDDTDGVTVH